MTQKTQEQYAADFAGLIAAKPANANINGQTADVLADGTVSVTFNSMEIDEITALRDWLTTIIGS